ncbi:MAG: hypothetical protein JRH18_13830 [Deltaproteobacteria bacterium]|nr:hypothetical protein [Deltaproteobacteria bacterium]
METVLSFDVGGTYVRAGLFDKNAQLVRYVFQPSPAPDIKENKAEISAEAWWRAVCELAKELFRERENHIADVMGICVSSVTRTQFFLDENGTPLRPAIIWLDGRATAQADYLKETLQRMKEKNETADLGLINAYHPLSRIMWVKEKEPDVFTKTRWVLQPKDYVNYKLTEVVAGDLISSFAWAGMNKASTVVKVVARIKTENQFFFLIFFPPLLL